LEIRRFQQEQTVVVGFLAEELDQNAEEDVFLAGNIEGVGQRLSVIPIVPQ
jgi:hypothetical protein